MSWVPVSRIKHLDKALTRNVRFFFAKNISAVPICIFEIQTAVSAMPLMFMSTDGPIEFYGLVGLEKSQNLLLTDDGHWYSSFVPAAIKCHPFASVSADNEAKTLLIEEESDLIVDRKDGEPLFNEDGSATKLLQDTVKQLKRLEGDRLANQQACSLLNDFDLFQPFEFNYQRNTNAFLI